MRIWAISDTHGFHSMSTVLQCDMLIYAGDSTNYKEPYKNQLEFEDWFKWLVELPIKHKIVIAGNHDTWALNYDNIKRLKKLEIIYLEHEFIEIEGITIFGSPFTPLFGNWNFMKNSEQLKKLWKHIPENLDILVTHGPPKDILDVVGISETCGDLSLREAVMNRNIKHHIFGHIHNNGNNKNSGSIEINNTIFRNVSCVTDNMFEKGLTSNGQIFDVN